jgi:hypothetical protein
MKKSRPSIARHLVAPVAALAATLTLPPTAAAQVRIEPDANLLVSAASPELEALFRRNGYFLIAGGVVPGGSARFFLEQNGTDQPIAASAVQPVAMADGSMALRSRGATYQVGMPPGLACPLGQFVSRDGLIAYTVPKYVDQESPANMVRAGLVRHRVAREFDGTPFVPLLKAADFGDTQPLPPALTQRISDAINKTHGIGRLVLDASMDLDAMIGSYLNSGLQVSYHVYLMPGSGRVEIGGVPLRYYWTLDNGGAAAIFSVEMYAQDWPAGSHLTNVTAPDAKPTQYDIVNFYQVAGLFQQLHESDAAGFASFVDRACGKAI